LFRQLKPGAWDEPMGRLRAALAQYLNPEKAAVEVSAGT
jgi:hypothetical protein